MSGTTLPLVMTEDGPQATLPATLNSQLIALATGYAPGLTANLPGSLIEDISSTATGALVVMDQARVDLVNSITPFGANAFLLNQLGQVYGVTPGETTNTSVFVVFSGSVGYVIQQGFLVSDGSVQYAVQTPGAIGTSGSSPPLLAIATTAGSFSVPANTVVKVVTSVPSTFIVTVSNPIAGSPATDSETETDYRSRVLSAGLAGAQGMPRLLRTLLSDIPGVQPRLVSIQAQLGGGWKIIVGGSGDTYAIGNAIYQSLFDISSLVGSVTHITNVTNTNPATITTDINHGLPNNAIVVVSGATGMAGLNNFPWTVTVTSATTFTIPFNATAAGTYTGNGVLSLNFRNLLVTISDPPDRYTITYVTPPAQTVTMVVTWNTTSANFVSPVAVASLAQVALSDYINSVEVGQPINLLEMQTTFQSAIGTLLDPKLLTRLVFSVSINGVGVSPVTGTGIILGDPESYFTTQPSSITVNQG